MYTDTCFAMQRRGRRPMTGLRSDSPLAKRIVGSFLRFLDSVELTPNADSEAVTVANQCLADLFCLDSSPLNQSIEPDLISLFRDAGYDSTEDKPPEGTGRSVPIPQRPTSSEAIDAKRDLEHVTIDQLDGKLFEQFRDGIDSAGYFDELPSDAPAYQDRLEKAKILFADVLKKARDTDESADQCILAEAFKAQGNNSMAKSQFIEAIDLYTLAISLCGDNAIYYSNRAAAHTQVGKYDAAIADSKKAIQLDPNYTKAYSRLGLAYYTQGKYRQAIEDGFQKAYALDPNNKSVLENLQMAKKKLSEERSHGGDPDEAQRQEHSSNQGSGARYNTDIPFNIQIPEGMSNLLPTVANLAAQFSGRQTNERENGMHGVNAGQTAGIPMDGNINVTVEGDTQLGGLMHSMLQMLTGTSGQARTEEQNYNSSQEGHR